MSKKDFELIVRVIHRQPDHLTRRAMTLGFVDELSKAYPIFDCERFIDACLESDNATARAI